MASWVLQLRVMAVVAASELVLAASIWPSPVDEEVFSAVMAKVGSLPPGRKWVRSLLGSGVCESVGMLGQLEWCTGQSNG